MTFEGRLHSLIDGGVVANNPTACAIAEALRRDREVGSCGDLVVLSVGSGELNRPIDLASAGLPGGRAWWPIDMMRLVLAAQSGQWNDLRTGTPAGLSEALGESYLHGYRPSSELRVLDPGSGSDRLVRAR